MRLSVASLRRLVKRPLHVEFTHQELTSYSGLELLRRYLRQLDLPQRLRTACAATGGDYGGGRLALLVLALLYVGARRLEHLRYVAGDPLIARSAGWRGCRRRARWATGCASSPTPRWPRWSSSTMISSSRPSSASRCRA